MQAKAPSQLSRPDAILVANNSTSTKQLLNLGEGCEFVSPIGAHLCLQDVAPRICDVLCEHGLSADIENTRFSLLSKGPADPQDVHDAERIKVYIDKECLDSHNAIVAAILKVIDQNAGRIKSRSRN